MTGDTLLGGYRLGRVIGRGGMGVIYRATHPQRDEPVALKVISPDGEWDEEAPGRFAREIRAARAVAHRHILPVYEAGEADGRFFVAMKLVERGDLGSMLRREGRLAPAVAVAIVAQVAKALDAAHAHGLVHRDVKPGNVLLDDGEGWGHAYLADFGVTRMAFSGDAATALTGTVGYSAPEQIRGETVDARSDVYGLGCVLYECLTGELPFERRDAIATLWAHLHDDPPAASALVPELPAALADVLARALAKDPRDRYPSAGAFAEAAAASLEPEREPAVEEPESQLPVPLTSFLGRERELAEAGAGLRSSRLVTVTGPGGAGKTRFALELAQREESDYPDGAFACFLAPLRDAGLVTASICRTLGVRESPGQSALEALAAHLAGKRLLLLIDNFEHVQGSVSDLEALIRRAPGLTVLATSRERLRVNTEAPYALPPLGDDEAVLLFCERAGLDPEETVEAICARLDGLPLAIELAAARSRTLSPDQLLELLSHRLDLLEAGTDADPRQQTLRATIEWSYELLTESERRLFGRLSVFAGGCTLEAAEAVCEADPNALQSLLDKSLLRFTGDRYWMLETIREYAAERLHASGKEDDVRRAHAEWFVALAERIAPEVDRRHSPHLLEELERERANFRAVVAHAKRVNAPTLQLRLAIALRQFLYTRGPFAEGRSWFEDGLEGIGDSDPALRARGAMGAGNLAYRQGDHDAAEALWSETVEVYRAGDDRSLLGRALTSLGLMATGRGNHERGRDLLEEAVAHLRATGDDAGLPRALNSLGVLELADGNRGRASALFGETLTLAREEGAIDLVCLSSLNLGLCAMADGLSQDARRLVSESLTRSLELGDAILGIYCLETLAALSASEDACSKAARLLGAAGAHLEQAGGSLEPYFAEMREKTLATLTDRLGATALAEECSLGEELTLEEAAVLALERVA
ncbi:MAG TPA: protein kinase [Gaiellaceae bacterium]|nr:protein kinase [Gaiellaceae bacterium]